MKLLVVWKSNNETDINNFVIPYVYNSKKLEWFEDVELLIWGASQEKVLESEDIQNRVKEIIKSNISVYACKWCSDKLGASDLLESLGVTVKYTGELLSDRIKSQDYEVITI